MADQVHFEIVSPERLLFSANVGEIVMPGIEGDFTVLPGHSNLISTLRPGVIYILENGTQVSDRIFVEGGFAEVNADSCTVLAEQAVQVAEIDRAKAEQRLTDAREDVQDAKNDIERATAVEVLEIAEARLTALGNSTY